MINRRLTSVEAAGQLGVKPATLYSYVSRGVLSRERTAGGSTFDAQEVARLARTGRHPSDDVRLRPGVAAGGGRASGGRGSVPDPVFVTELTAIEDGHLYYRGLDVVELSRTRTFEEVAGWLWSGKWPDGATQWRTPPRARDAVTAALLGAGPGSLPVERWMVAVAAAALTDDLRHDLSAAALPIVGRALLSTLVDALPMAAGDRDDGPPGPPAAGDRDDGPPGRPAGGDLHDGPPGPTAAGSISARLWPRLTALPLTARRQAVLEAALVLSADHELAPSTLAARVAAAFRADPYAVVSTGLGPASGSWRSGSSGAPGEVEALLREAEAGDAERAIGERLRRTGSDVHGFGMPLYPEGDPRGAELLGRLDQLDGHPARRDVVQRVLAVGAAHGFAAPNVDMGLGALAFCAEMVPGAGQAIATLGKVAGWLAHAMEEYAEPTRFRTRAAYIGPSPGG